VKYLVDTHCWLWLQVAPERLGGDIVDRLADPSHELLLSAASAWEIAIKHALGKLELPEPPDKYVPSRMQTSGTAGLPVVPAHALAVASLPLHHRDPFDRLLVAQAQQEGLTLVTADEALQAYDVELIRV
jgi:PIN domain nuclease of toxin-antitoxin system